MDEFELKINSAVNVLLSGSLKKNMDDALLSKFLDFLESVFEGEFESHGEFGDLVFLLEKTNFLQLFEVNLTHVFETQVNFDVNIANFSIRALGIFLSHQKSFNFICKLKTILPLLENLGKKDFSQILLLHSAVLSCLYKLSECDHGINWILSVEGIIDKIFQSSLSPSYYVRNDAEKILCNILTYACSVDPCDKMKPLLDSLSDNMKQLLDSLILERIYMSLKNLSNSFSKKFYLSVLKSSFEASLNMRSLLLERYRLLHIVANFIQSATSELEIPDIAIFLFADCCVYSPQYVSQVAVNWIIGHFTGKAFIVSLQVLLTSVIMRKFESIDYHDNIPRYVSYILQPFLLNFNPMTVQWNSRSYFEVLTTVSKKITPWVNIIQASLTSLIEMSHCLHLQIYLQVVDVTGCYLCGNFKKESIFQVFKNQKIKQSLLRLTSSLIKCRYFNELDRNLLEKTLKGLVSFFLNEENSQLSSMTFMVIKEFVEVADIDACYNQEFLKILTQPYFENSLTETSLEIFCELLSNCQEHHKVWLDWLCSENIYQFLYTWAYCCTSTSYFRYTAIKAFSLFYINNFLWTKLCTDSSYGVTLDNYMKTFLILASSTISCVQNASVTAFSNWIKISDFQNTVYYSFALKIFTVVIHKSEYDESKITALSAYQYLIDNICNETMPVTSSKDWQQTAVEIILSSLSKNGFIHSALYALNDYYNVVKIKTLQILLHLRQKLTEIGIKCNDYMESSNYLKNNCLRCNTVSIENENIILEKCVYTDREKQDGISFVINQYTTEMIDKLGSCDRLSVLNFEDPLVIGDVDVCCKNLFWKKLWSEELEFYLTSCFHSSDVYENNPIALLDDIIAAKENKESISECLVLDCY